jgi:hypothetical protein
MTPVEQTNYGKHNGNCLTACVASILDLPVSALPEFCIDGLWFTRLHEFCAENGFSLTYWKFSEQMPLCLGAYVIVLLRLEGEDDYHAVVGRAVLESIRELGADADIEWTWHAEIVHDPNTHGYPPVKEVAGYILISKQ